MQGVAYVGNLAPAPPLGNEKLYYLNIFENVHLKYITGPQTLF